MDDAQLREVLNDALSMVDDATVERATAALMGAYALHRHPSRRTGRGSELTPDEYREVVKLALAASHVSSQGRPQAATMRVPVVVEVEKEPTNEVEGDAWVPSAATVAAEAARAVAHRETDDGWRFVTVEPAT